MRYDVRRRPSLFTRLHSLVCEYRPKFWIDFRESRSRKLHRPIRLPARRKRALTPPLLASSRLGVLRSSGNSKQQTADQRSSPFLSLPLELRLKIYEYVFFSRGIFAQIVFLFDGKCERPVHFRCRDPERCIWDDNCWNLLSLAKSSNLQS
jgi:hypothetical protein